MCYYKSIVNLWIKKSDFTRLTSDRISYVLPGIQHSKKGQIR